ncbi:MAG: hypothetical protein GPJ51_13980 [Candidatus Heimdallarchaeota archaeon]|nr:hypothetical protein [Candidatus Heimdallarchaeota archaeon]
MEKPIDETLQKEQSVLDITPELEQQVHEMLTATERNVPDFWESSTTEILMLLLMMGKFEYIILDLPIQYQNVL